MKCFNTNWFSGSLCCDNIDNNNRTYLQRWQYVKKFIKCWHIYLFANEFVFQIFIKKVITIYSVISKYNKKNNIVTMSLNNVLLARQNHGHELKLKQCYLYFWASQIWQWSFWTCPKWIGYINRDKRKLKYIFQIFSLRIDNDFWVDTRFKFWYSVLSWFINIICS